MVDHFGLWQEELVFTALMIEEDVRNNSAWNQRCHLLSRPDGSALLLMPLLVVPMHFKQVLQRGHESAPTPVNDLNCRTLRLALVRKIGYRGALVQTQQLQSYVMCLIGGPKNKPVQETLLRQDLNPGLNNPIHEFP